MVAPAEEALKRSILETTIGTYERAKSTQEELASQGEKIAKSLGDAENIAKRTIITEKTTGELVDDVKATKTQKIINCCLDTCCCCCCCSCFRWCFSSAHKRNTSTNSQLIDSIHSKANNSMKSPSSKGSSHNFVGLIKLDDDDEEDNQSVNNIDQLELSKLLEDNQNRRRPKWKRTLEPPPGVQYNGTDIWYRQVDVSLNQLHQLAEDMGQSLEEQIRLAQMLNVYLNFGIDRVINVNENLQEAKDQKNLF